MSAESPIKNQPTSYMEQQQQNPSNTYALSGRVMLASILTIFIIVFFLLLLHLYARWYLARLHRRNPHTRRPNRHNRSTRIVYYLHNTPPLSSPTGGLDTSVLNSLPLFVYSTDVKMAESECAVCLSEFQDGETGRVLPNCKHSFHTECIDMWFFSHSTCPLCRSPVIPLETEMTTLKNSGSGSGSGAVSLTSPVRPVDERTGTSSETDTRKRIDVRIDVPNRNESGTENEFRSPGSRLASLKRLLSMSRKSPVVSPSAGVGPSSAPVATGSVTGDSCESVQESSRPIVVDR